jgi:hypothetical protein
MNSWIDFQFLCIVTPKRLITFSKFSSVLELFFMQPSWGGRTGCAKDFSLIFPANNWNSNKLHNRAVMAQKRREESTELNTSALISFQKIKNKHGQMSFVIQRGG